MTTKTLKERKCKLCKNLFTPIRPLQPTCFNCAGDWIKLQNDKKWRVKKKEMKVNLKTHKKWQNDLQPIVNHIARLIDRNCNCISCGNTGKPQGGHYHSRGANNSLRFNLHDIHLQDYYCNEKKSGNITGYNKGLITRYGKEYQEYIEYGIVRKYPSVKLSIPELKECIQKSRAIVRELQKDETQYYTPEKRLEMRKKYNIEIGIFPE